MLELEAFLDGQVSVTNNGIMRSEVDEADLAPDLLPRTVVVNGLYHYLRTDGRVFRSTPGVYRDDNLKRVFILESETGVGVRLVPVSIFVGLSTTGKTNGLDDTISSSFFATCTGK